MVGSVRCVKETAPRESLPPEAEASGHAERIRAPASKAHSAAANVFSPDLTFRGQVLFRKSIQPYGLDYFGWRVSFTLRAPEGSGTVHLSCPPLPVSYTHLRAHETRHDLVCRLLLE